MQATPKHTYKDTCREAPVIWSGSSGINNGSQPLEDPPPLVAQFFYHTPVTTVDDPLATTSTPAAAHLRSDRGILRPFSQADNNDLERTWQRLGTEEDRQSHAQNQSPTPLLRARQSKRLEQVVQDLYLSHKFKHKAILSQDERSITPLADGSTAGTGLPCCPELPIEASTKLRETFCRETRRRRASLSQDAVVQRTTVLLSKDVDSSRPTSARSERRTRGEVADDEQIGSTQAQTTSARDRSTSIASRRRRNVEPLPQQMGRDQLLSSSTSKRSSIIDVVPARTPGSRDDKYPPAPILSASLSSRVATPSHRVDKSGRPRDITPVTSSLKPEETKLTKNTKLTENGSDTAPMEASTGRVVVGVSKLHEVSLPALLLKPIYWSPVGDIAVVSRATWFYGDTMMPIEPIVANQLEIGYRELRPYTETWQDELRCAVEVGALGEEKVTFPLWPYASTPTGKKSLQTKRTSLSPPSISSDPFCAARCFQGEAAAEGSLEPVESDDEDDIDGKAPLDAISAKFAAFHVLYKNAKTAFLLKPALKPSAYYGRRPVGKITRGVNVGIPVVRGFDRGAWDKIHDKNKRADNVTIPSNRQLHKDSSPGQIYAATGCPRCAADRLAGEVTDLVLTIHGIGQSLAERVASYHFTHAVTAVRRAVNHELHNQTIRPVISQHTKGIVLLPINWRQLLSFQEGGAMQDEVRDMYAPEGFSLKDIEPRTIPAVRSLMSDVLFDIPFYMSHHKPTIIQALVGEANRVYRLWCKNNPDFAKNGRVHLIGHSLGSVMAVDILSRQPTDTSTLEIPRPLTTTTTTTAQTHFDFNTSNLFLVGSPAGFFLLLERGSLVPRHGRMKPGADRSDVYAADITGDAGSFGCLAVDNVYNILAKEDPIAYLLNGTFDAAYAASLRPAFVPSATAGWLKSVGDAVKNLVPGATSATAEVPGVMAALAKPPTARLPSQLELEVHDFTREEVAEKKAFLLNDNGQVDYYLRSGGGPLDVQYLNMLSAHTSYWTSRDFIRLLCVEIGRKPGKAHTLPAMRAVKASRRIVPGKSNH